MVEFSICMYLKRTYYGGEYKNAKEKSQDLYKVPGKQTKFVCKVIFAR